MRRKITNTYQTIPNFGLRVELECGHHLDYTPMQIVMGHINPRHPYVDCIQCNKIIDDPIEAFRLACFGKG